MEYFLPIAQVEINILFIFGLSLVVGILSGLFGVGGGFLMTPLLIFLGIPAAVAVSTEANQIVASSVSGVIAHWRKKNVDFKMGFILLIGGYIGSSFGVWLFAILKDIGQIELVIRLSYVVFLGMIGFLMAWESTKAILKSRTPGATRGKLHQHNWLHGLPFKMRFRRSKLYSFSLYFIVTFLAIIT